jgi:hypothetical protein
MVASMRGSSGGAHITFFAREVWWSLGIANWHFSPHPRVGARTGQTSGPERRADSVELSEPAR